MMRTSMRQMKRRQMASGHMCKRSRSDGHRPDPGEGPPHSSELDAFDDSVVHVDQGDGVLVPGGRYALEADAPSYALPDSEPPGWGEP